MATPMKNKGSGPFNTLELKYLSKLFKIISRNRGTHDDLNSFFLSLFTFFYKKK